MFELLLSLATYSSTPQLENVDINDSVETTQVYEVDVAAKGAGTSSGVTQPPTQGGGGGTPKGAGTSSGITLPPTQGSGGSTGTKGAGTSSGVTPPPTGGSGTTSPR
jgi:hypothetical protein